MQKEIGQQFRDYYGNEPLIARAPGRVNLIGEHTDYNEGFVLPAAIDRYIYVAAAPGRHRTLNLIAAQYDEKLTFPIDDFHPIDGWATYVLGMLHHLMPGHKLPHGLDMVISGDVPLGAGMSSSAALCSAVGVALNEMFGLGKSTMEIALMGQKTEHTFAGVQCGIMDEFASMHGREGNVMKLDCRSLEFEYIPFDFPDHRIVLVNTMVSHALGSSEYNTRRGECEEAVAKLRTVLPGLRSLRDVTGAQVEANKSLLTDTVYRRCRFITGENERLLKGCERLAAGDLAGFGQLMFAAHEGLSRDYEISCEESDFLVEEMKKDPAVLGARQMGGGFGGCIIVLLPADAVTGFRERIAPSYEKKYGKRPDIYVMNLSDGARISEQLVARSS